MNSEEDKALADLSGAVKRAEEQYEQNGQNPWLGVSEVVKSRLTPVYENSGVRALGTYIDNRLATPYLSRTLVVFSSECHVGLLSIFEEREVVEAAIEYLKAIAKRSGTRKYDWAWFALTLYHMTPIELVRITFAIIEKAPDNDGVLWMIGDGPLSELEEFASETLCQYEKNVDNDDVKHKLERIRTLVESELSER
jgi:hypothetical protein